MGPTRVNSPVLFIPVQEIIEPSVCLPKVAAVRVGLADVLQLGVVVAPHALKLPEEPITQWGEYWCEVTVSVSELFLF